MNPLFFELPMTKDIFYQQHRHIRDYESATLQWIESKKWDMIQRFPFQKRPLKKKHMSEKKREREETWKEEERQTQQDRLDRELIELLISRLVEDDLLVSLLLRLFPDASPSYWSLLLSHLHAPYSLLRAFLARNQLELSPALVFYVIDPLYHAYAPMLDMMDDLLLAGLDITLCNEGRTPLLHLYLYSIYDDYLIDDAFSKSEDNLHHILPYLLHKGADPLLQDKHGKNAFDILHIFRKPFPPALKQWIYQQLKHYA